MSMFEDNRYRWRETYFVLFHADKRPALRTVEKALASLNDHYRVMNGTKDAGGRFESLTLISPDDFAALDICYTGGAEVREQGVSLADELRSATSTPEELAQLRKLKECDGRFEVLHFEQVADVEEDDDEMDEILDPSALLLVLDALAHLTDGLAIDPQAGTILSNDE